MNERLSYLVIANAMAVLFIGLIAGVFLTFALLNGVGLWPLPILDDIWGTLAYLGGGTAMFALFIGVWILGDSAFRKNGSADDDH